MIFRNFAFVALVITSTTLSYVDADRSKLRDRWQVGGDADSHDDLRRGLKKDKSKKKSSSADVGDRAETQYDPSDETAVVNNYADFGGTPSPPAKNSKKKKGGKNKGTGQFAGTFNYAAVSAQPWNPSGVTLGAAVPGINNYASPGAATGNLISSTSVGAYNIKTYQVGTQEQEEEEEEPVPVITNYVTDTNSQQVPVVIAPPVATANNGQGEDIATSINRAAGNQAQGRGPVCSIGPGGCCSSNDCGTNCCNFQYGCVEKPTDLPWMTQYLEDFCM